MDAPEAIEHSAVTGGVVAQTLIFLAATCLVVPAFRKARLAAPMGYLLIGVAMGPFVLGRLAENWPWLSGFELERSTGSEMLAEFGVVFLLFIIGLEVSWERLASLKKLVFGLGVAQVLVTAAVITGIAVAFGNSASVALVLGMAFALSSTALVLQLLREGRRMDTQVGRASFSVLLLQDLMVVPILFVIGALELRDEGGFDLQRAGALLLVALVGVAAILLIGRLALRPLFRWVASIESREAFVAAALLAAIGAGVIAQSAGLSMAMGAFLGGLILAETEFRHQIESDLEPFKDLLLGLFFVAVGMQIDPALLLGEPALIALGVFGLFIVKGLIIAPLARLFGLSWPRAIEMAFLLGQAGEFGFIVIGSAEDGGLIPGDTADYMLMVTALSIFLTPLVALLGARAANAFFKPEPAETEAPRSDHVVIAGFGRVGQMLSDILGVNDIPHAAVDCDADLVSAERKQGRIVHFGDASRRDALQAIGADKAVAIVVTMDRADAIDRIVAEARRAWPNVPVFARARDAAHAKRLHAAGARLASPDTIEAALQLGEAVLSGCGVPDEAVKRIIDERREAEITRAVYGGGGDPNSSNAASSARSD